ncbi:hypothetical protein N866_00060 [Actinotalea ferrariae CF5-4]|uniref:Uncharacterized protein n=1 Tax=Actinotalea ferrariae CF5-4 TaxID=948458 RepID=A0A021W1L0_9CELL|nr:hypothetical protein N866_00060 [Actinotalea ferrariae CF5-4]
MGSGMIGRRARRHPGLVLAARSRRTPRPVARHRQALPCARAVASTVQCGPSRQRTDPMNLHPRLPLVHVFVKITKD